MKRITALAMAVIMMATAFTACSSNEKTIKEGTTLKQISEKIDSEFGEYGAIAMATEIDETTLKDLYYINPEDVEEFYGTNSMSMTNSDAFLAVKAKDGKVDSIKESLEKRKADLEAQFEFYPVNGSYVRAKSSEIYQVGNYVFFICVGVMPNDPDVTDEELDFTADVAKVKGIIDGFFN